MATPTSAGQPGPAGVFRADLATGSASARQARVSVRQALAAWGMDDPSGDAELLFSELVTNTAEHTGSHQIGFVLRGHIGRDGQRGVTCEVTDTSPILPRPRQASDSDERRRDLAIVTALATTSGAGPRRAARRPGSSSPCPAAQPEPARPPAAPEREPEAGA